MIAGLRSKPIIISNLIKQEQGRTIQSAMNITNSDTDTLLLSPFPAHTPELKGSDNLRVLILDDDDLMLAMYRRVLPHFLPACIFTITDNGMHAIADFDVCPYDVVVTDINMPQISGLLLYEEVRQLALARGVNMPRFIFCSGVGHALESVRKIIAPETAGLLLKPFNPKRLVEMIDSM